jgi:hypothetical protein
MKTETLQRRIGRVLARYPFIDAAYLFGSQAAGRPDSDVDVPVVGPRDELQARETGILADSGRGRRGPDCTSTSNPTCIQREAFKRRVLGSILPLHSPA